MLDHPHNVQALKDNDAEALHERTTEFACKIPAAIGDPVVHLAQCSFVKLALSSSFAIAIHPTVDACQIMRITSEEARVGNLLAGRKRGKVQHAQVNANRRTSMHFCFGLGQVARRDQIPAVTAARERQWKVT